MKTSLLAIALFLIFATNSRAEESSWHLFTQSEGGTVSLLHGLTKETCEFAMNRALGQPATEAERQNDRERARASVKEANEYCKLPQEERRKRVSDVICSTYGEALSWSSARTYGRMVGPGDIRRAECFQ